MLRENLLKVGLGFIFGTVLMYYIQSYHFFVISLINMIFFTCFYTIIDKILKKLKNERRMDL